MRPAGRAVGEGVRAAGHARRRADRVFTREELLRRSGAFRRSGAPGRSTATRPGCGASCARAADDRLVVNVWGVGYRLMRRGERVDERRRHAGSVVGLYQQLACRARRPGAGGARPAGERRGAVRRQRGGARGRRRRAAARRHTFIALDGPLPGLFAEQAGALLAVAARFEEAADLSRAGDRQRRGGAGRDRADLPRRRRRPARARRAPDGRGRLAGARHMRRGDPRRRQRSTAATTAARRPRRSPATT